MSKNPSIRPGLIIKEALQGQPMGISEIYRVYKDRLETINSLRSKADKIRGGTYWSFARQCQFARALGLIEYDHEKRFKPFPKRDDNPLLAIRNGKVTESTQVIYRLTAAGNSEDSAWRNLAGAVRDKLGWG